MAVERLWHWACDSCGAIEVRSDYGLPRGWIYVKAREVTHRCPGCAAAVPKDRVGRPVVVAEK